MEYKYKVGDTVRLKDYKDIIHVISGFQDTRTYKSERTKPSYTFKDGAWDFEHNLELIEPYKEEVMNDKIEVGDTVEIISASYYSSYLNAGDKALVTNVSKAGVCQLNFLEKAAERGSSNLYQASDLNFKDLKLVSKAKQNMKEVIGYNIKPEFRAKSAKIALALDCNDNKNVDVPFYPVINTTITEKAKSLGVFELWFEPVYKSSEVVVKLSKSRTATITSKTICTITLADGSKFLAPNESIDKVLTALNGLANIAGYKPKFKEFELGCQTFTIDDLYAVNQAFKDFQ